MEKLIGEASEVTALQRIEENHGIALGAVYGEVNIISHQRSSPRQRFMQSLAFLGMNARAEQISKTPGTCDWLVQHPTFSAWEQSSAGTLWIKGGPGTGKSTLLHHVLHHMRDASEQSISLHFFINAQGSPLDHSLEGVWRCLLHQAVNTGLPRLERAMEDFESRCELFGEVGSKWKWLEQEIQAMLRTALEEICDHRPAIIFLDGLDEAGEADATRIIALLGKLTDAIVSPRHKYPLKVCFSCRRFPLFDHRAEYQIETEEGNEPDISKTIASEVDTHFPLQWRAPLRLALEDKAKSSYQWVILSLRQIDRLRVRRKPLEHILHQISNLPLGLESLYDNVLKQLDPNQLEESIRLFRWVLFAVRTLTLEELWVAMHLNPQTATELPCIDDQEEFRSQIQRFEERILDLTGGLFRKTKILDRPGHDSWGLEPIHQSAVDYMKESGFQKLAERQGASVTVEHEYFISRCLITYILRLQKREQWLRCFLTCFAKTQNSVLPSTDRLCRYASYHWTNHLKKAEEANVNSKDIAALSVESLSKFSRLQSYMKENYWGFAREEHWILDLLLVCTCSGLCDLLHHLKRLVPLRSPLRNLPLRRTSAQRRPLVDTPSRNGKTLLCTALMNRQYRAAEILIDEYYADPNARLGSTPGSRWKPKMNALLFAIASSNSDMVSKLLKAGAHPNQGDGTFMPLNFAMAHEDEEIAEILIQRGARLALNKSERSLFRALALRRWNGIADLLGRGSLPSSIVSFLPWKDIYLLEMAHTLYEEERPQFDKINKLIDGFDANKLLENGLSPLAYALQNLNATGARAFIECGASMNGSEYSRVPAFVQAVYHGVPLLIDACTALGAQWSLKDQFGRSYVFSTLKLRFVDAPEEDGQKSLDMALHMYSIGAIGKAEYDYLVCIDDSTTAENDSSLDNSWIDANKEPYWDNWKHFIES